MHRSRFTIVSCLCVAAVQPASAHISSSTQVATPGATPVQSGAERVGSIAALSIVGADSWDAVGDLSNDFLAFNVATALGLPSGSPVTVTGIGWDVTITTVGASRLNEPSIRFFAAGSLGEFQITPGSGVNTPGSQSFIFSTIKLADAGIPNLFLPNGMLDLEFYELFDDVPNAIDATWNSTIFIQAIPTPSTALFAAALSIASLRRRR